jgi:hypothetical protein
LPGNTSDTSPAPLSPVLAPGPEDPELARVALAWPALPPHVRQTILTLVAAAAPGLASDATAAEATVAGRDRGD